MANYTGFEPGIPLSQASANNVVTESTGQVFFNKQDLNNILAMAGAKGVRFYPIGDATIDNLVAIGVDENRHELDGTNPYYRTNGSNPTTQIDRSTAQTAVADNGEQNQYNAYFSRAAINEILAKSGVIGLRLYDHFIALEGALHRTFVMVGVESDMSDRTGDNEYVMSDKGCPPVCNQSSLYDQK